MEKEPNPPFLLRSYGMHKMQHCLYKIIENEKIGININKLVMVNKAYLIDIMSDKLYGYPNDKLDYVIIMAHTFNKYDQLDLIGVNDSEYYHIVVLDLDFDNPIIKDIDDIVVNGMTKKNNC